jgi:hypothetical protein
MEVESCSLFEDTGGDVCALAMLGSEATLTAKASLSINTKQKSLLYIVAATLRPLRSFISLLTQCLHHGMLRTSLSEVIA